MTPNPIFPTLLFALLVGAGTNASAGDGAGQQAPPSKPGLQPASASVITATRSSSSTKMCRADEDTLRVLRLTTVEGGVRVDYEFVVSGRATWTNMNRPLLKQFGIRAAGTFCLPKDTREADDTDDD